MEAEHKRRDDLYGKSIIVVEYPYEGDKKTLWIDGRTASVKNFNDVCDIVLGFLKGNHREDITEVDIDKVYPTLVWYNLETTIQICDELQNVTVVNGPTTYKNKLPKGKKSDPDRKKQKTST
jgi:hypothetical protein